MPPDPDPVLQAARIEEEKYNNMLHFELGQRPIYRPAYPEYAPIILGAMDWANCRMANLGNPNGLTAEDQAVKTKRAKTIWE